MQPPVPTETINTIIEQLSNGYTLMNNLIGSTTTLWIGRILSSLTVLSFLMLAVTNLFFPDIYAEANLESGLSMDSSTSIGIIATIAMIFYAWPRSAILGAILITGFLGGSMAINMRIGASFLSPPMVMCMILGAMAWGGIYLRDPVVRMLLPIRSN